MPVQCPGKASTTSRHGQHRRAEPGTTAVGPIAVKFSPAPLSHFNEEPHQLNLEVDCYIHPWQ